MRPAAAARCGRTPMRIAFACVCAVLALLGLDHRAARAQDYPTRPVKILIAFPVGGLLDTVSRIVGEKMTGLLGQQFVRSEEHTSELQSLRHLVCRLLL